jgi:hypothetical protein
MKGTPQPFANDQAGGPLNFGSHRLPEENR